MFGNIKAIIQFLKIVIDVYQFVDDKIDEDRFNSAVKKRKENYKKFIAGSRDDMLDVLRDENES
jgi:uncharacterized protein YqeY